MAHWSQANNSGTQRENADVLTWPVRNTACTLTNTNMATMRKSFGHIQQIPFKDEAQTVLFKDPVRTAQ